MIYIVFIMIIFLVVSYITLSHAPIFKISDKMKKKIIENGLIHFTSMECWESICKNGFKGQDADMGFPETLLGKMVWTYQYIDESDIEIKHKIVVDKKRGRENPKRYGICIKITGISEDDLDKLYTRYGYIRDKAIVYRGEWLKSEKIELIKEWK